MSHYAFFVEVEAVRAIPGADRIQVSEIMDYDVVTSKATRPGDRGILITEGAQVDRDFALEYSLLRKHPETGAKLDGYLEDNRRVRAMRLRGQKSEGIFVPFEFDDDKLGDPAEGVAVKYETPAQLRVRAQSEAKAKKPQVFPKHYDTAKLRYAALDLLRPGLDRVVVTEKLHGTSGRTASVREETITSFAVVWNVLVTWVMWAAALIMRSAERLMIKPVVSYTLISGTRNVILDPDAPGEKGMSYRQDVHNALAPIVHDGERWYYEIVGYGDGGVPIMAPHGGEVYSYGCERDGEGLGDRFKVYVYRVVDPNGVELGSARIDELIDDRAATAYAGSQAETISDQEWISTPPVLEYIEAAELGANPRAALMQAAKRHSDPLDPGSDGGLASSIDSSHIREGVCMRGEDEHGHYVSPAVKYKGFEFCRREGIRANDDAFVDLEAVT